MLENPSGARHRSPHGLDRRGPAAPQLHLERSLVHEHAETGNRAGAAIAGGGQQRCLEGLVTRSTTDRIGAQGRRRDRKLRDPRPCRPASRSPRSGRRRRPKPRSFQSTNDAARGAAATGGIERRAVTSHMRAGHSEAIARRRAAPPAPSTSARRPGTSTSSSASDRRNPSPSVETPAQQPSARSVTVLTLRRSLAPGDNSSHSAAIASLVRHRRPESPASRARDRLERRGNAAIGHLRRGEDPVEPERVIRRVVEPG